MFATAISRPTRRRPAPPSFTPVAAGVPEPPIVAFAVPANFSVDVYWHSSLWGSPTSYEVHRSTSEGFTPSGATLRHTETGSARVYSDSPVSTVTTYYYKVVAVNSNGSSTPTTAIAYPDSATAISPLTTLSGPVLPGITQWWELNQPSDGIGRYDRLGELPTLFHREWQLPLVDDNLFGSYTASTTDGGRVVANFTGDSQFKYSAPNVNTHVGHGSWSIVARLKQTSLTTTTIFQQFAGSPGFAFDKSSIWLISQGSGKFKLLSYPLYGASANTVESTLVTDAGVWYTVCGSYDETTDKLSIVVVDPSSTVMRTNGGTGIGPRQISQFVWSIAKVGTNFSGQMGPLAFFREALTNTQLLWLNGSGSGRTFAEARFQPMDDPGPAPFSFVRTHTTTMITHAEAKVYDTLAGGFYWYCPYPLYQWDPAMAATKGRYLWIYSSDHGHDDGILLGFSADLGVRPTSWIKAISAANVTHTSRNTLFDAPETAFMVYNADDADNKPFYLYVHRELLNNLPTGVDPGSNADFNSETFSARAITIFVNRSILSSVVG